MEVTIDLETCKIIVYIDQLRRYAVFISKWTGQSTTMSIPALIKELKKVAERNEASNEH